LGGGGRGISTSDLGGNLFNIFAGLKKIVPTSQNCIKITIIRKIFKKNKLIKK
jgi:hypothetical protein